MSQARYEGMKINNLCVCALVCLPPYRFHSSPCPSVCLPVKAKLLPPALIKPAPIHISRHDNNAVGEE